MARARFTTAFNIYKINKIENEILFTLLAPEALAQTVMLEYGHALNEHCRKPWVAVTFYLFGL